MSRSGRSIRSRAPNCITSSTAFRNNSTRPSSWCRTTWVKPLRSLPSWGSWIRDASWRLIPRRSSLAPAIRGFGCSLTQCRQCRPPPVTLISFWIAHRADMLGAIAQHLLLTLVATAAAIAIAVPLGIVAARRPRLGAVLLTFANIAQTVPSLAMFGFLVALPLIGGVGARSALIVLILYALLPVMRNTVAGIQGIDRAVRDAGVALGMTPQQLLLQVELPLAMPTMVAGVRVAAVVGVGAATIAAAIGAGGLGDYIFRGLSMTEPTLMEHRFEFPHSAGLESSIPGFCHGPQSTHSNFP